MRNLIGTDEAGYGPNLGPMTVTGTLWQNGSDQEDLYHALADTIKPAPDRKKDNRIVLADSKVVYKASGSIANLETSVLSVARLLQAANCSGNSRAQALPGSVAQLFNTFCPQQKWTVVAAMPWYDFESIQLPLKAKLDAINTKADHLITTADAAGVSLLSIDCRCIFPSDFNRGLSTFGNKASLLSNETLNVLSHLKSQSLEHDLEITCDKHGGRSRYAELIQNHLTDATICVGEETTRLSDYSFTEQDRDVVIRFQAGGETFLPTALASMISKYIREVFMEAWNRFWCSHIPGLKPTKGYPQDAKRFKSEIQQIQEQFGFSDADIWRRK